MIWRQGLKKAPFFSLLTGFANYHFASKGEQFYNDNDHNNRNEDLNKHRGWTTKNIICNKKAYEPVLRHWQNLCSGILKSDVNTRILHYRQTAFKLVCIYRNKSFKILDITVSGYTLLSGVLTTMWQKTTKHSSRKLESLQCSRKYHGSNPKLVLAFHPPTLAFLTAESWPSCNCWSFQQPCHLATLTQKRAVSSCYTSLGFQLYNENLKSVLFQWRLE